MRVLHILSQLELTGSEAFAHSLIQEQTSSGQYQPVIVSDQLHLDFAIPFYQIPISQSGLNARFSVFKKLREIVKKHQIEIIHAHSRAAARHAFYIAKFCNIPVVSTLHGRQHPSPSKKLFNIYGSYIAAICENIKTSLVDELGMNPRQIRVIPNAVAENLYPFQPQQPPKDKFTLGVVSRTSGPKGDRLKQLILDVFPVLLKKHPHLHIEIVAKNIRALDNTAVTRIGRLHAESQGRFVVHENHTALNEFYPKCTAVIGAGRVAIESLLSGCATLSFGEFNYEGLVTVDNLNSHLKSNFGDIGTPAHAQRELPVSSDLLIQDIEKVILGTTAPSSSTTATPATPTASVSTEEKSLLRKKVADHFSSNMIHKEYDDIYKSARFKHHVKSWIPILMYHKIPDAKLNSPHRIFLVKDKFETHLQYFKYQKMTPMWFSDLKKFWDGEISFHQFPKKPLILTFDDGYKDNLTNALPLLQQYQTKANLFLLARHDFTHNQWDEGSQAELDPIMTLDEKKQIANSLFEIGSHGFDHLHLTSLAENDFQKWKKEINDSKSQLEKDLGVKICAFAYPFGDSNTTARQWLKKSDYTFAVNTDHGGLDFSEDRFSLFRVNIFPEDGVMQLWKKTESWYRKYFYFKRRK